MQNRIEEKAIVANKVFILYNVSWQLSRKVSIFLKAVRPVLNSDHREWTMFRRDIEGARHFFEISSEARSLLCALLCSIVPPIYSRSNVEARLPRL